MPSGKKTATSAAKSVALQVEGIGVPVEVRRHHAARRFTLRVSKTRRAVVVTVPTRARMDDAGSFLNKHIDWVRERLGNVPEGVPFAPGSLIPLRGRPPGGHVAAGGRGRIPPQHAQSLVNTRQHDMHVTRPSFFVRLHHLPQQGANRGMSR